MVQQKSRALLIALSIGTASAFALPQAALAAAPEIYFYPTQSWTVGMTPMEIAHANVQSCTISNEFNNGFIISMDGSHDWVTGMSIDFRQDVFSAGKTYNAMFSVPGKLTQEISATAEQNSKLIFSIKDKKEFYQAMRDSSVIDLQIDNNDFRFYMTGFSNAAGEFERCMAGGFNPPAEDGLVASISEDPYAAITVNESIALEEAERSGRSVDEIYSEMAEAQYFTPEEQKLATPEAKYAAQTENNGTLKSTRTSIDNVFSPPSQDDDTPRQRMTERLAAEIEENPDIISYETPAPGTQGLREEARQEPLEMPPVAYSDTPEPMQEIVEKEIAAAEPAPPPAPEPKFSEAIQRELEKNADIIAATSKPEPKEEILLPEQKFTETNTKTTLNKKTHVKTNKETTYMEADFTSNLADVEPSSAPMDFGSYSDPELIKKISQLERMVADLENENAALNDEIQAALKDAENERMSISSDNWNLERATMRYNEAERQVKRIGQQLQRERAQCEMEKKDIEAMLFDPQVTSQQQLARLAELERALNEARSKLRANGIR